MQQLALQSLNPPAILPTPLFTKRGEKRNFRLRESDPQGKGYFYLNRKTRENPRRNFAIFQIYTFCPCQNGVKMMGLEEGAQKMGSNDSENPFLSPRQK